MASGVKLWHIANEMDTLSDEPYADLNRQTGELATISREELQAAEKGDRLDKKH